VWAEVGWGEGGVVTVEMLGVGNFIVNQLSEFIWCISNKCFFTDWRRTARSIVLPLIIIIFFFIFINLIFEPK